jgi:hypothetical protein
MSGILWVILRLSSSYYHHYHYHHLSLLSTFSRHEICFLSSVPFFIFSTDTMKDSRLFSGLSDIRTIFGYIRKFTTASILGIINLSN